MSYVEVKGVDKRFGSFHALDSVSFGVEQGELVALLGPSGSGKTTILRIIAGLESADAGDISIDGQLVNNIPGSERGIGFVFQNYALFRYMNVWDNIAFGLDVKKVNKVAIAARVDELIKLIGLEGKEKSYPNELSGGQRQRVAFARALAPSPHVLLLDEPFAAIDAKIRSELRQWLRSMITRLGITSIFVTHDQEEAIEISDRIIVMSNGKIEQIGDPTSIYETPATAFVAGFSSNDAAIIENYQIFNGYEKTDPDSRAVIRPEYVEAFRPDNEEFKYVLNIAQPAVVENVSFRGFYYVVTLNMNGVRVNAHRGLGRRRPILPGMKMLLYVDRLYIMHGNNTVETIENPALAGKIIVRD